MTRLLFGGGALLVLTIACAVMMVRGNEQAVAPLPVIAVGVGVLLARRD